MLRATSKLRSGLWLFCRLCAFTIIFITILRDQNARANSSASNTIGFAYYKS
jgi:hypothetical protein